MIITYLYGVGGQIHRKDALTGKVHYYFYNGHGDVTALADGTNKISTVYDYSAYGEVNIRGENIENPFRYFGQYYDEETGSYYLRARYYDPSLMRITNEDTYQGKGQDPLSLNKYLYCIGNPVGYVDESGKYAESVWDALNIGLDVFDVGMDFYTGDYWSLLIDIPALIGDSAAITVPLIPGGIGTLKTPLRMGKTIKTYEKIQYMINTGTKLDGFAKAFLRYEARTFMIKNSSNFAKAIDSGKKLEVHHVIPLEWAYVMGKGFDPNMLDNLAGVDQPTHKQINRMWDQFRKAWKDKTPTAYDVMEFAKKVN